MSLLLQALQKAARNREQASAASAETSSEAVQDNRPVLDLEPGDFSPERKIGHDPSGADLGPDSIPAADGPLSLESPVPPGKAAPRPSYVDDVGEPTPQHAANLMQAAATAKAPRFDFMEWAREHPVYLFAAAAFVFLAGYGGYVYIAITQPQLLTGGGFNQQAPGAPTGPLTQAPRPPATATAATAAPSAPSLLPDVTRPQTPVPGKPAEPAPAAVAEAAARPTPSKPDGVQEPAPGGGAAPSPATAPPSPPQAEAPGPIREATAPVAVPTRPAPAPRAARRSRAAPADSTSARLEVRASTSAASITSQLNEAYAASRKGESPAAREIYQRVLENDPRNVDAMLGLASIAWQDGKTEQASELYYRILQSEPQNAAAQAGLIGLAGRVDPVASETRLKQLIAREPSGSLYFALGNLHASQGKWAAAQQAYFQAVEADSGNPDYVFNLAVALEHIGQQKPALANYRKALDLSLTRGGGAFDQKQVIARIGQLSLAVE